MQHQVPTLQAARELLGVPAHADARQVVRAYRRRARRLHPDVSSEANAAAQFWALQAAYRLALEAARDIGRHREAAVPSAPPVEHRDPTVVLDTSRPVGAPARESTPWLAVGPVSVHPARRDVIRTER